MHYHTVTEGGTLIGKADLANNNERRSARANGLPKSEKEFGYADLDPEGWGDRGHW